MGECLAEVRQVLASGVVQYMATGRPNANTKITMLDTFLAYRKHHFRLSPNQTKRIIRQIQQPLSVLRYQCLRAKSIRLKFQPLLFPKMHNKNQSSR